MLQGKNIKYSSSQDNSDSNWLQTRDNLNPILRPPLHPSHHSLRSHPGSCHSCPSAHGIRTILVVHRWWFRGGRVSWPIDGIDECLLYWNITIARDVGPRAGRIYFTSTHFSTMITAAWVSHGKLTVEMSAHKPSRYLVCDMIYHFISLPLIFYPMHFLWKLKVGF